MKSFLSRLSGLCALFLLFVVGTLPVHAENVSLDVDEIPSSHALLFSDIALNNQEENGTVVVLNHLQYAVTIPGDNLTWLARRFDISMRSILELNPEVASRTDPARKYWIYLGETITIPVYTLETKLRSEVSDSSLVVVPLSYVKEQEQEISNLKEELFDANKLLEQTVVVLEATKQENELARFENKNLEEKIAQLSESATKKEQTMNLNITEVEHLYNQTNEDLARALIQVRDLQDDLRTANTRAMIAGLVAFLVMVLFACWFLSRKNKDSGDPDDGKLKRKDTMPTGSKFRDDTTAETHAAYTIDPDIRQSIREEEARQGQKNELASVLSKDDSKQDQYASGDLTEAPKVREVHVRENSNPTPFKGGISCGISSRGELNEQLDEEWVKEIFGEVNEVDNKVQIREFFGEESRERAVEDLRKVFCEEESKKRTAEDLIEHLRSFDGKTLAELMSLELTKDEDGKAVSIKNIASFMAKRGQLNLEGQSVFEWTEIFRKAKEEKEKERKVNQAKGGNVIQMPGAV